MGRLFVVALFIVLVVSSVGCSPKKQDPDYSELDRVFREVIKKNKRG